MADEIVNESILIKTDQQNILVLDPNSLLHEGRVVQRMVDHERLVMYVNLEADIVPRSKVYLSGDNTKEKSSLVSLYKGNINFLKPKGKDFFDTSWTDLYTDSTEPNGDVFYSTTSQNFGIRGITIRNTFSMIPQVNIQFVDVRGKTLFENHEQSPYKAFFHLPYPVFYLTVKGFYGKAIRYQLMLTKFNARFDSSTGNYEINCDFVGPTTPLLNDITIQALIVAPYMYPQEINVEDKNKVVGGNTTETTIKVKNTTKGFEVLKQVYDEYKAKGIVPNDFPYITLRDLAIKAEKIDILLEQKFFKEIIDPKVLSDMDDYDKQLTLFAQTIKAKGDQYLNTEKPDENDKTYFRLAKKWENSSETVLDDFLHVIDTYQNILENNRAFGKNAQKSTDIKAVNPTTINFNVDRKKFYLFTNNTYFVSPQKLLDQIFLMRKEYTDQRRAIEEYLAAKINEQIKGKDGIGFDPTIRNVFAVILAAADTFIRLLDDVHNEAINVVQERGKLITDKNEALFPFPMIIQDGGKDNPNIITYPADPSVIKQLHGDDFDLWPEIEFVENYYKIATELVDTLANKELFNEPDNLQQEDDKHLTYSEIMTWNYPRINPYKTLTTIGVFYELYERAYVASVYSGFEQFDTLRQFGLLESGNVRQSVKGITVIENKLKQGHNLAQLKTTLRELSPYKRWEYTKDDLFTTPYLKDVQEKDFDLYSGTTAVSSYNHADYAKIENEITNYVPNLTQNLYPFTQSTFVNNLEGKTGSAKLNTLDFSVSQSLSVDVNQGLISNQNVVDNFYTGDNDKNIFKDCFFTVLGNKVNILNTPYFTNALNLDIDDNSFARTAFLFLNALPIINLYNKYDGSDEYAFASFNQIAATHRLPYLFVLKIGSLWHRYKTFKTTGTDVLGGVFQNNNVNLLFDNESGFNLTLNVNGGQTNLSAVDHNVGFYPYYHEKVYQTFNGNQFFNFTGITSSEYETKIQSALNNQRLLLINKNTNNIAIDYYTAIGHVKDGSYFLFPSSSFLFDEKFDSIRTYQNLTTRIFWDDPFIDDINFTATAPRYFEHLRTIEDAFSFEKAFIPVDDLLATFKPEILDLFEEQFEAFARSDFKAILRRIMTLSVDPNGNADNIIKAQNEAAEAITGELMDKFLNLKIGNPKEINLKDLKDFAEHDGGSFLATFYAYQVTSGTTALMETLIGRDAEGKYLSFFKTFNLAFTETHFRKFRLLARFWAGSNKTKSDFMQLVTALINSFDAKLDECLSACFRDLSNIDLTVTTTLNKSISVGFNDSSTLKLELYNSFKRFNDSWIGGNIIGDKTLMDDFLFLDRANRDIGQKAYVNLFKLNDILDKRNAKMSLYGFIGDLLKDSGFIFFSLPAYVNFYGIQETGDFNPPRYTTSAIASDLFGTFLEVDYIKSSPKFLCQYVGLSSGFLNMNGVSEEFKFKDDSFNMSKPHNPFTVEPEEFLSGKFDKSNRVVCFEINFGDQAQGVFKGISLDQAQIKNTAETYSVIEQIAKNNSGSNTAQADTGLYHLYQSRNYTCEVQAMGNAMIQPGMYFYLNNIPMFEGSYLITEVNHSIANNNIETMFKGTRIPFYNLPDLKEILISTNKIIYQRLLSNAKSQKTTGNK